MRLLAPQRLSGGCASIGFSLSILSSAWVLANLLASCDARRGAASGRTEIPVALGGGGVSGALAKGGRVRGAEAEERNVRGVSGALDFFRTDCGGA